MLTTKCPWCRGQAIASGDRLWQCTSCKRLFDDDPTEGGDYGHDPAYRLQREERERAKRQARLRGGR